MISGTEILNICSRTQTRTLVLFTLTLAVISVLWGGAIAKEESDYDGISRGITPFVQVFRHVSIKRDETGNAYMVLKLRNNTEATQCARTIDVRGSYFEDNAIVSINGNNLPYSKFNDWAERKNIDKMYIFRPGDTLKIPVNINDYYQQDNINKYKIEVKYFLEFVRCEVKINDVEYIRSSWSYKEAYLGGQYVYFKIISSILKPIWFFNTGTVLEIKYIFDPNIDP